MAILIPSKNIYNKNNPKVRDNVVDNVSVSQSVITPKNEYDVSLINEKISSFSSGVWQRDFELIGNMSASYSYYVQEAVGVGIKYKAVQNYRITIPKAGNNKYISSVSLGVDNENNPKIKSTIHYVEKIGTLPISFIHKQAPNISVNTALYPVKTQDVTVSYSEPNYTQINENLIVETINTNDLTLNQTSVSVDGLPQITASVAVFDFTNLGSKNIISEDNENYYLNISVICGYEKFTFYDQVINYNPIPLLNGTQTINATATKIEPTQLEITVYGNTIGIDLKDGTVQISSGNKPFSLEGNELLQDSGTVGGKSIAQHLGDNVINQYKKGKETANILCNISDYYAYGAEKSIFSKGKSLVPIYVTNDVSCSYTSTNDYSTLVVTTDKIFEAPITVVVSYRITGATKQTTITIPSGSKRATKKVEYTYGINRYNATLNANMVFEQNDKVIPMVLGADGNDHPMSVYQNGEPKIFTVVGTDIIFDGAVWQELTLQEYNN